ncbi:MAG: hypothetical protein GF399_10935 [Candidatus Coatesbacteria bacterium]|nr:hypothetical protein [Candidatus Coatesbacteria bacterium]
MKSKRLPCLLAGLLGLTGIVFLGGCASPTADKDDEGLRSTVGEVFTELERAYEDGDLAGFTTLFAEDLGFTYHFDDDDVDAGLPEQWGLAEELNSAANLFAAVAPADIYLRLDVPDYTAPEGDTFTSPNVAYDLRINDDTGLVQCQGILSVELNKNGGAWYIVDWRDFYFPQLTKVAQSWGAVKYEYR